MPPIIRVGCYNRRIFLVKHQEMSYEKTFQLSIKPQCRDCKYFIKEGKCSLFKDMNDYITIKDARSDNNLCGPDGYYFKK